MKTLLLAAAFVLFTTAVNAARWDARCGLKPISVPPFGKVYVCVCKGTGFSKVCWWALKLISDPRET